MFTPPGQNIQFTGGRVYQFIQHGFFAGVGAQYASQTLNVFAHTGAAGNNNTDIGFRHIHAFIENFAGHQYRTITDAEIFQHIFAFRAFGMMSKHRQQIAAPDLISRGIVCGKNNDPFTGVTAEQAAQYRRTLLDEGFEKADENTMGQCTFMTLTKVILPLSRSGIISGVTMVLVPSISTFYISQKLGGGTFELIGDTIERQFVSGALNVGAAISLVMMVLILISLTVMNKFGDSDDGGIIV